MRSSLERKVLGGLGLASIIITGVTIAYHVGTEHLVTSNGKVAQAHELLAGLSEFSRSIQAMRMTTRGYVISGDANLYTLNQAARGDLDRALSELREATSRSSHRKKLVQELDFMAKNRIRESNRLITLRQSVGGLVASVVGAMQYSQGLDDPMTAAVEELRKESRTELDHLQRLAEASHVIMFAILFCGAVIELAFAVAAAGVVRRDLEEHKKASEAIAQNERALRSFYDSGVTMMGIVELLENDVVHVSDNSATGKFVGKDPKEMCGKRCSELGLAPHVVETWVEKYRESFRRGGPVQFEYPHDMPDGSQKWLSAVVCPIQRWSPTGRTRFSYIAQDVTEQKNAADALKQHTAELTVAKEKLEKQQAALEKARNAADAANSAKSNFLANMSHEIRTPMTAVLGYSDLLAEAGKSDDERAEYVSVIRRNAMHLLELINDILDLSKIEAGQMMVESVVCEPARIIGDVVEMMKSRAAEKKPNLHVDYDGPLPQQIKSDPLRLRQVLINLVGNAIKFTEAGEVVLHVGCQSASGQDKLLNIVVRDTGIGMTEPQVARLFKPFTQADETTTRRFGGTGLGLTISHRLAQMMGGTLSAESKPGMGSIFKLTLPFAATERQQEAAPAIGGDADDDLSDSSLRLNARILLAEDAADMQRLQALLLRRAGANVTVVSDGLAAVEMALRGGFDVIIMDMQMPVMDGYTAAEELRRRGVRIPIIALTAHAMSFDRDRCIAAGCTDYLTKPVEQRELVRTVRGYLPRAEALVA